MKDLALQKPFLQTIETTSPQAKNYYAMRKLFSEYFGKLNVAFYDTCCPSASIPDSYPTRYFDGDLQYFDGTEWSTISVGGAVTTQMSVTQDGSGVKLVNDETSPGNYQVYSTDSVGTRGWNDGIFGSGTTNFLPVYTNSNTVTTSRINQYALNTGGLGVDDLTTGITTANGHVAVFRNFYVGDATANQIPFTLFDSRSTAAVNLNVIQMSSSQCAVNSIIKFTLGRSMSTNNMLFNAFNYVGSGSAGNYLQEIFYAGTECRRAYASGNTTFGVTSDNGFKVEIGGTSRIRQKLTLGAVGVATGTIDFVGSTSGIITLIAANAAGTYTLTLPTAQASGTQYLKNDGSGILSWDTPVAVTTSSAYTPTLTNSTNITASTAYLCTYHQIGDVVTVSGRVSITPTAGAWTQTILRMSIPVASAFTANEEGAGTANAINIQGNNGNAAGIRARATGGDMEFVWLANDTNAHDFFFTFSYQIVVP